MSTGIVYVDGGRLRRSLLAAADRVQTARTELNRINVFPVPDGDTGTNFSLTMRAVAEAMRQIPPRAPLMETARAAARASVREARGNSGMLLAHFLLGFTEALADQLRATASEVAAAFRRGADRLEEALDEPIEGTILTVSREAALEAERAAERESDLASVMRATLRGSVEALERTPDLLPVLREAGVVDAGAKGFVYVLEGIVRLIDGASVTVASHGSAGRLPPAAFATPEPTHDFRYCTQVLVRGPQLPGVSEIRSRLRLLGDSIVVTAIDDLLKVHVHTDHPDELFTVAAAWGVVESQQADDVREQHRRLSAPRTKIALVADSSNDLPPELAAEIDLIQVPLQIAFGDEVLLDGIDVTQADLYRRLRAGATATTSQPTPGAFQDAFGSAGDRADTVLAVLLGRSLSGTYGSAEAAARQVPEPRPVLVDSRGASLGLGLLLLRAAELAREGWAASEIAAELCRVRDRSGMLFTVDRLDGLVRSGRVSAIKGWLGGLLDLKPILSVTPEGDVAPAGAARGRAGVMAKTLDLLDRALTPRPAALRLGVAHADCPTVAEQLANELEDRYRPRQLVVAPVTGALAVHTGLDAWGIFYQVEDGTAERQGSTRR